MLSFFTDAWAEIGREGNGAQGSELSEAPDGFYPWETSLMAPWTIFYWGWWISWAPFVGTYLARISRGRTIKNVLAYSLGVPLMYCFVWFGTFGGAALRMHQQAKFIQKAGTEIYNDADRFLVTNTDGWRPGGAGNCYNVP